MCTYTVIKDGNNGFRIAFNRDELRKRAIASPPQLHSKNNSKIVYPVDNPQGGTWIGVNNYGVTAALLNTNSEPGSGIRKMLKDRLSNVHSRGIIIPEILGEKNIQDSINKIRSFNIIQFMPFRLIIHNRKKHAFIGWTGEELTIWEKDWDGLPIFYTSSGLGDSLVENFRYPLFKKYIFSHPNPDVNIQDYFHSLTDKQRPHLSVCMDRPDAQTVSYTTISINQTEATVDYYPDPPCKKQKCISVVLKQN